MKLLNLSVVNPLNKQWIQRTYNIFNVCCIGENMSKLTMNTPNTLYQKKTVSLTDSQWKFVGFSGVLFRQHATIIQKKNVHHCKFNKTPFHVL